MKESYWGYWLVMLGILVIGVMLLINSTTNGTTHDYYELKETTSAAVIDAVDYSYYRLYGDLKISKEKFIENFIRRFSESATMTKEYNVSFYDIHEVPPKVSVKISTVSNAVNVANSSNSFDLVNKIDVILVGGSKDNNPTPGDNNTTTPETCYILNTTQTFMKIIKEILVDGTSTYGVDTALVQRIRHAGFTNLNSWSKTDCNISSDDCVSKFNSALNLDFSGALQLADTRELLITNDPTYVKDSNDETSGILGYALNKGYITLTK